TRRRGGGGSDAAPGTRPRTRPRSSSPHREVARSQPIGSRARALADAAMRCEREQEAAVVVVGREDVGDDALLAAGTRPDRELLAEPPHAPFLRELERLRIGDIERFDDVAPDQVLLGKAGELED